MKKIIYILGAIFLAIIIILNIGATSSMNIYEHIHIELNSILHILGLILLGLGIFFVTKFANKYLCDKEDKKSKIIRRCMLTVALIAYVAFSVIWTNTVKCVIEGDQVPVIQVAQGMYNNNMEEILPQGTYAGVSIGEYIQTNQQQIPLAFIYSIFFRIIHSDKAELLRIINIVSNVLIIMALYKITKQVSKEYKTNKVLLFTLILTFLSIPMLSTFIYGDIPSLASCLFAVYFIMKYREKEKYRYVIGAAILTAIACMMRMNSLIFVIATVMYLIFNLIEKIAKKPWKEKILSIAIILVYIVISIVPSSLVKNYFLDKYKLDKSKAFSSSNYILMAMMEGRRSNGWYNEEVGEYTLKNPEEAKEKHKEKIKERLQYFSQNVGYAGGFYVGKLTSTWTENTYSAIRNNMEDGEDPLGNIADPLTFYQKALLIVTCLCSLIVLIQNRKNLSLDVIFLLTIFVGGFAFHILWETKSRYIIPYIVVLIPIASIAMKEIRIKDKENIK